MAVINPGKGPGKGQVDGNETNSVSPPSTSNLPNVHPALVGPPSSANISPPSNPSVSDNSAAIAAAEAAAAAARQREQDAQRRAIDEKKRLQEQLKQNKKKVTTPAKAQQAATISQTTNNVTSPKGIQSAIDSSGIETSGIEAPKTLINKGTTADAAVESIGRRQPLSTVSTPNISVDIGGKTEQVNPVTGEIKPTISAPKAPAQTKKSTQSPTFSMQPTAPRTLINKGASAETAIENTITNQDVQLPQQQDIVSDESSVDQSLVEEDTYRTPDDVEEKRQQEKKEYEAKFIKDFKEKHSETTEEYTGEGTNSVAEEGTWEPLTERDTTRRDKGKSIALKWFTNGYFKTSGQTRNADGKIELSPAVKAELEDTMRFFKLKSKETHYLFESVSVIWGISPDTDGRLWKKVSSTEGVINDQVVIDAWKLMKENVLTHGHPFAYTKAGHSFANSERYPVTILRIKLANALANGRPGNKLNMNSRELWKVSMNEWVNKILPAIQLGAKADQKTVLFDIVDAIEEANGSNEGYSTRLPDADFTLQEAMSPLNVYASLVDDPKLMAEIQKKVLDHGAKMVTEAKRSGKTVLVDKESGEILVVKDAVESSTEWALRKIVAIGRINGIIFDPVLLGSAMAEHALGTAQNKVANGLNRVFYGTNTITKKTKEIAKGAEFTDAFQDLYNSYRSDRIATLAYLHSGGKLGDKTATNQISGVRNKVDNVINKMGDVAAMSATGRFIGKTWDAENFIINLQHQMQKMPGSTVTAKSFEAMLAADPVSFLETAIQTEQGRNAILFSMDATVDAANVANELFHRLMKKSALVEAIFAATVTKYGGYGINLSGKILPLSHTFNYLAAKGLSHTKYGQRISVTDLAIGGNEANFWNGLAQNLVLDAAWLGTRSVMLSLTIMTLAACGVEPPDEEENYLIYGEWKVRGIKIKENWMFRDLLGFITPAAMGIQVAMQTDIKTGWQVFLDGAYDAFTGLPFLEVSEMFELLVHFDKYLVTTRDEVEEQWGDEAPDTANFYLTQAGTWGMRQIANFLEPRIIRSVSNESGLFFTGGRDAPSTSMIYSSDPNDDPDATVRTTWSDSKIRQQTKNSPLLALIADIIMGTDANDGVQRTGYGRNAMPIVSSSDPTQMTWTARLEIGEDTTEEEKLDKVHLVIDLLEKYSNQELIENGVILPYETRQWTYKYINSMKNVARRSMFFDRRDAGEFTYGNGRSYDENNRASSQAYDEMQTYVDSLNELSDRLRDSDIPYSPDKYTRRETNYMDRYSFIDSGEPATKVDYYVDKFFNDGKNVQVEWLPSGDYKSSFDPGLIVENTGNFGENTGASWYGDKTSWPLLKELYSDQTVPAGIFSGENAYDMLSSYDRVLSHEGSSDSPLFNQRAWKPKKDTYSSLRYNMSDSAFAETKTSTGAAISLPGDNEWTGDLGDLGLDFDASTYSSGGKSSYTSYGGYSYSGGGGSSYTPNIYSHPAYSLNTDKPATMYAKIPSYAKFDYLRPGYETKGSREAYKRSDI